MTTIERPNVSYGNGEIAIANEILRSTVGSGLHGIAIEGTDDHDEMGVFIEPPGHVVGTLGKFNQHVWRTKPEGERSGPGDTDLVIYSLRKYLKLAAQGNPTVLLPLWAPEQDLTVCTFIGEELRANAERFVSKDAGRRFLGYMLGQRDGMLGLRRTGRSTRTELLEQHGYDTKFASHAVRLAYQGVELMRSHRLELPMHEVYREQVLAIKRGEVSKEDVLATLDAQAERLQDYLNDDQHTPEHPDREWINDFSIRAHLAHWTWRS